VKADRGQLEQVVMNLVVNARDAMPDGGQFTIEGRNVEIDEDYCRHHPETKAGSYVQLSFTDTGWGMDDATQARIFEPFFTTKEQGKGTGLGLASVYGIVRQSGGHIAVESAPGCGTAFHMYLPRVDRGVQLSQAAPAAELAIGTETILVVEDEADVRKIASQALRNCGYRVIEAADAQEALKQYRANAGTIRVLLTDIVMPGMNGVELSKCLIALDSRLKVIYVSGYADGMQPGQERAGVVGAVFLQKPYRPRELAARVRELLVE